MSYCVSNKALSKQSSSKSDDEQILLSPLSNTTYLPLPSGTLSKWDALLWLSGDGLLNALIYFSPMAAC